MDNAIPQGLDPTAFILTKAIGRSESNGADPYNATGDNGTSIGRYQIQKKNWSSWAAKYLGDANAAPTEENQNKLAYAKVKEMLDSGLSQSQVASTWNSGHPDPNTVGKGFNAAIGVAYDVPGYVSKVQKNYQQIQTEINKGFNPTPYSAPSSGVQNAENQQNKAPQPEPGLGQQISGRATDFSSAVNRAVAGQINPISGVLQAGGAIAGGLGDVVNKGLELIPGVKQLESLIGKGVGSLAQTPTGQSVVKAIKGFSDAHPELAADIGAGFNIATAIPIFEGLGAIKNLAMDSVGSALQNVAKKSVIEGTADAMSYGKALSKNFLKNGGKDTVDNAISVLGKDGVVGIEGGKYATQGAYEQAGKAISNIENGELQAALQKVSTQAVADRVPLEQLRQEALQTVRQEFRASGNVSRAESEVNRVFNDYKSSYGDYVTLQDVNDMKRGIRTSVNFNSPKLESDVTYHIGQTLQTSIEDAANRLGLGDVRAINQKMANLIKYQNMLKALDKTPARMGRVRGILQHAVGVGAGSTIGGMLGGGVPGQIVGGYVGNQAAGLVGKASVGGITGSLLREAGPSALKQTAKTAAKKGGGLIAAALAQRSAR